MVSNTHEILMLETDESDSAPVPKSKANRVLKEISSSTIPSWQTPGDIRFFVRRKDQCRSFLIKTTTIKHNPVPWKQSCFTKAWSKDNAAMPTAYQKNRHAVLVSRFPNPRGTRMWDQGTFFQACDGNIRSLLSSVKGRSHECIGLLQHILKE